MADKPIRVLIVDDESLARDRIRLYLKTRPNVSVIGECRNGREALNLLTEKSVDLVFLDISMPDVDGIELIDLVGIENFPPVIFTTAYDEYAVKAFELHAVDYLLKPFSEDRFLESLERAEREMLLRNGSHRQALEQLVASKGARARRRLLVRDSGQINIVEIDDIDHIEAAGNYLMLHLGKNRHMIRETMKGILERLHTEQFVRIHRSYIVNIERIKRLIPQDHGDFTVELTSGHSVPLSRRFRPSVEEYLGEHLA